MVMTSADHWTVDDLDGRPDDGLQYEIFDGVLVVSAAPSPAHQRTLFACARLLHAHCPPELEVFVAPLDFRPTRGRSLQPDVLVARRASIGDQNLTVAPVLAVEVLSDGTRSKDLIFKQEMYQTSGVASYWVIDPAAVSIVAYDLDEGIYRRGAQAQAGQTVSMRVPFTVPVCPADLIAGR